MEARAERNSESMSFPKPSLKSSRAGNSVVCGVVGDEVVVSAARVDETVVVVLVNSSDEGVVEA